MDWLKNVGTSTRPIEDAWRDDRDWLFRFVTSRQRMGMKPGDGIAYYATGLGSVFALGSVTSFVYERNEEEHILFALILPPVPSKVAPAAAREERGAFYGTHPGR